MKIEFSENNEINLPGNILEDNTETIINLDEPDLYSVLLLNDDYTTMEFVVEILEKIFNKTANEATQIMLNIHNEGKGKCGVYPYDIAEMKAESVKKLAKANGFPLRAAVEPE